MYVRSHLGFRSSDKIYWMGLGYAICSRLYLERRQKNLFNINETMTAHGTTLTIYRNSNHSIRTHLSSTSPMLFPLQYRNYSFGSIHSLLNKYLNYYTLVLTHLILQAPLIKNKTKKKQRKFSSFIWFS